MLMQSSCCRSRREEMMVARNHEKSQTLVLQQGWKARLSPCIKEDTANSVSAHQRRSISARMCCDSHFLAGEAN